MRIGNHNEQAFAKRQHDIPSTARLQQSSNLGHGPTARSGILLATPESMFFTACSSLEFTLRNPHPDLQLVLGSVSIHRSLEISLTTEALWAPSHGWSLARSRLTKVRNFGLISKSRFHASLDIVCKVHDIVCTVHVRSPMFSYLCYVRQRPQRPVSMTTHPER